MTDLEQRQQMQHLMDIRHEALSAELVALVGSDKQITWADSIRRHALGDLNVKALGAKPEAAATVQALIGKILAQTSAAWWIDNQGKDATDLITIAYKAQ